MNVNDVVNINYLYICSKCISIDSKTKLIVKKTCAMFKTGERHNIFSLKILQII